MAIATVIQQDFPDFEIIVSDNASDDDYAAMVSTFNDARIKLFRQDSLVPVTANWNNALAHASGEYIMMLGDDDGPAPGCLASLDALIARHRIPDVVYVMAYYYAYPNVLPDSPAGYLATLKPRPIFSGQTEPFFLDPSRARHFAVQALRFRHLFGFNSQFFIWRREFVESLADLGPFFQSPYPDFYSSFVTMLMAKRVLVDPEPRVIIGVSPKSFGFYFLNDQVSAGNTMLALAARDADAVRHVAIGASAALDLPGSAHYRNWLIAALFVIRNFGQTADLFVDFRRFRRIQVLECAFQAAFQKRLTGRAVRDVRARLSYQEARLFDRLSMTFAMLRRSRQMTSNRAHEVAFALFNIYPPAETAIHGSHRTIMQAWAWLERRVGVSAYDSDPEVGTPAVGVSVGWWTRARAFLTLRRHARRLVGSGLFDRDWYLSQYPDVRAAGVDPLRHYLRYGVREGRNPGPMFDTDWYLARYPDVRRSGENPALHFLREGAFAGYDPNPLFDSDWYLRAYPDVRRSGTNPLIHYLRRGAAEGRQPGPRFDAAWYLTRYPDVSKAGVSPLEHYLRFGVVEGRFRRPSLASSCSAG